MNPLVRWFHQLGSPPYFDRFAARWTPWCYLAAIVLLGVGIILAAVFLHPLTQRPKRIEHPEVLGTSEAKNIVE